MRGAARVPAPPTRARLWRVKRVYASDDFLLIGHLRQVLEAAHVPCFVRNEHLVGGAGELPPIECWPEVWITEDHQLERAQALVKTYLGRTPVDAGPWQCPACAEPLEGQFTQCWQCGEERPPGSD